MFDTDKCNYWDGMKNINVTQWIQEKSTTYITHFSFPTAIHTVSSRNAEKESSLAL